MVYTFVMVNSGKSVEIFFLNDEDAIAHAKRLAAGNDDVAIYIAGRQLTLIRSSVQALSEN